MTTYNPMLLEYNEYILDWKRGGTHAYNANVSLYKHNSDDFCSLKSEDFKLGTTIQDKIDNDTDLSEIAYELAQYAIVKEYIGLTSEVVTMLMHENGYGDEGDTNFQFFCETWLPGLAYTIEVTIDKI